MKKIATFILCFIGLNLYAQPHEAIDYITQNAVALNVTDANNGFEDLMPLKTVLSNRRIIGMVKLRMVRTSFKLKNSGYFVFWYKKWDLGFWDWKLILQNAVL